MDDALGCFIHIAQAPSIPTEVKAVTCHLDLGEQQAVALAYQLKAVLIIDDRLGRIAARSLGLSITGLAGVLIRAKEAGFVTAVRPLLEMVRQKGYWLSDELLDAVARLEGEG